MQTFNSKTSLVQFHFNLLFSLSSPRCHIELFLASFFYCVFRRCLSPCWPFRRYHNRNSNVLWHTAHFLLLSHLSVPIFSQCPFYPGCLLQNVFQLPFCDKQNVGFFAAISPPMQFMSFHSLLTFFLLFSNPLSIICLDSLLGFPPLLLLM